MSADSQTGKSKVFGNMDKITLQKCVCKENLMFREGGEIILKCRVIKIVDGIAWAKCKRCGQWRLIPLKLSN